MRRIVTPGRLAILGLVLAAVVVVLIVAPSNQYIFLPDDAHPVAPLVKVPGGHVPAKGGVYFVDVVVRKATMLERLFGGLHDGADLYPASAVNPPGVDDAERRAIDLEDMRQSQQVAAAVALKADGKKVDIRPVGATVEDVQSGFPAVGKLEPDDVITAIDGEAVTGPNGVFAAMKGRKIGATVAFTIRRATETLIRKIKTVASPQTPRRAVVGIVVGQATDIKLPIPISIDAGNVGGPSAGLAFALEVLQELGKNVLHGHRIAATGEIFADGTVGPIGGVKQKTIGARRTGVDAFLVPAGDNATEARKYAHGLRIIPVESFQQALRALATLL